MVRSAPQRDNSSMGKRTANRENGHIPRLMAVVETSQPRKDTTVATSFDATAGYRSKSSGSFAAKPRGISFSCFSFL
jgi:hypothetical protein